MKSLRITIACLIVTGALYAQPVPGEALGILPPGQQLPDLPTFLELTETQVAQIELTNKALAQQVEPLAHLIIERRVALEQELQLPNPDATLAGALVIEIRSIAAEIRQHQLNARASAVGVLTLEQQDKLNPLRLASVLSKASAQARAINLIGQEEPPADQ